MKDCTERKILLGDKISITHGPEVPYQWDEFGYNRINKNREAIVIGIEECPDPLINPHGPHIIIRYTDLQNCHLSGDSFMYDDMSIITVNRPIVENNWRKDIKSRFFLLDL